MRGQDLDLLARRRRSRGHRRSARRRRFVHPAEAAWHVDAPPVFDDRADRRLRAPVGMPEPDAAVIAAGIKMRAVFARSDRVDRPRVPLQPREQLAIRQPPQTRPCDPSLRSPHGPSGDTATSTTFASWPRSGAAFRPFPGPTARPCHRRCRSGAGVADERRVVDRTVMPDQAVHRLRRLRGQVPQHGGVVKARRQRTRPSA